MQFKLSTESFGVGVQLRAELTATPAEETLEVKPLGGMEIYQRRQMPRVDVNLPFCTYSKNHPWPPSSGSGTG